MSQKYIIQNKKNVHFILKRARVDGMGIILRRIIMGKIDVLPIHALWYIRVWYIRASTGFSKKIRVGQYHFAGIFKGIF